jgi:hypothetical protein
MDLAILLRCIGHMSSISLVGCLWLEPHGLLHLLSVKLFTVLGVSNELSVMFAKIKSLIVKLSCVRSTRALA